MSPSTSYLTRHPAADISIRRLLEEDIGLDSLEEALELATAGEGEEGTEGERASSSETALVVRDAAPNIPSKYLQMLRTMRDPALGCMKDGNGKFKNSITKIMRDCGIKAPEIIDIVRKRDIALAILNSGRHIYAMLDDMGEDARSRIVDCQKCGGDGVVPSDEAIDDPDEGEPQISGTKTCGQCDGAGKIRKIGDSESRKLLAKIHGLDKSGGGTGGATNVNVGVKVNAGGGGSGGDRAEGRQEHVTARVQKMFDMRDVREAEIVEDGSK